MGDFSRDYAQRIHGMNIREFQKLCASRPDIDDQLDQVFREECIQLSQQKGVIADYRLGGHFFSDATTIFLDVSESVATLRGKNRGDETATTLAKRNEVMRFRLLQTYGYDFTNKSNYRLVINTDHISPQKTQEIATEWIVQQTGQST